MSNQPWRKAGESESDADEDEEDAVAAPSQVCCLADSCCRIASLPCVAIAELCRRILFVDCFASYRRDE